MPSDKRKTCFFHSPFLSISLDISAHLGVCPTVEGAGFGICANTCVDDTECETSQKCCATACGGTSCMEAVQPQPRKQLGI